MYNNEEKTSKFLEAINKAAKEHCKELEDEVKAYSKAEMEKAEKLIHDECHKYLDKTLAQIKADTESKLASYENEKKEQVIKKRQEIENKVFADVYRTILEFSNSDKYENTLLNIIKEISAQFDTDDCEVLVREADLALESKIKEAFGKPCQVKESEEIILGGAMVQSVSTKILIDDTFESRLAIQKKWFEENSDLKIV